MSEEFEKELEDEINQVKELEHANRRFKVKIDMLEREKNTIAKKYDAKIELADGKLNSLEEQLDESEAQVADLESKNRKIEEEWEDKLAEEKRRSLETVSSLEKSQTRIKSLKDELEEAKKTEGRIDEYEAVLGKLMERNEELEGEARAARNEVDTARRQSEMADRRRAVKVKDLEEKIEEQRIMIEQQQETLDESVKTILKLYSLNNEKGGDDLSAVSEEKLNDMAKAMVPRLSSKRSGLSKILDEKGVRDATLASTRTPLRHTATSTASTGTGATSIGTGVNTRLGRNLTEEVEILMQQQSRARSRGRNSAIGAAARAGAGAATEELDSLMDNKTETPLGLRARSRGRNRLTEELESIDNGKLGAATLTAARPKSRGRGDRTETIRQLTERARTPGKGTAASRDRSQSPLAPLTLGRRSTLERYDPTGPISDSRALVPVIKEDSESSYSLGGIGSPPPQPMAARSSSRRRDKGGGDRGSAT